MKRSTALVIFAPVLALQCFAFNGCQTTSPRGKLVAQVLVQAAVVKVVGNNPQHAPRIVEIATTVEELAKGDTATTVAALDLLIRSQIKWEKLDAGDKLVVELLLSTIRVELESRLGTAQLPPEYRLVVGEVAGWIKLAAQAGVEANAVRTTASTP